MSDDRINSYVLVERLAIGGMGEIFLAEKEGPLGVGKRVVIKRILPDLAEDEQFVTGFEDEARVAMQLNHSNIVQVFDFGRDGDRLYLVSEYVEGLDLGKVLTILKNQGKRLPVNLALGILIRVASALFYAHTKTDVNGNPLHIVHRDINPSNVLISFGGDVKITDFGIAKFEARKARTLPNQIKGKVMYLAPEMIAGGPVDHRADMFSFGSMAYEMLCMEHPFSGSNEGEIIDRIRHAKHNPLNEKRHDLPMALVNIVERCLERSPDRRYPDMEAVQQDLTNYLFASHTVLTDSDIGRFLRALVGEHQEQQKSDTHPRTITVNSTRGLRWRKLWPVGLLIVVVLFAVVMWKQNRNEPVKMPQTHPGIRRAVFPVKTVDRRGMAMVTIPQENAKPAAVRVQKKQSTRKPLIKRTKTLPASRVIFRFFPARAEVRIDGKPMTKGPENIVKARLSAGRHRLEIRDTATGRKRIVDFNVETGHDLNLGTIIAGKGE